MSDITFELKGEETAAEIMINTVILSCEYWYVNLSYWGCIFIILT